MTLEEMQAITMRHWWAHHRKTIKHWYTPTIRKQSMASARLTRLEMDSLKLIGLSEEAAWSEAASLFCLAPPPELEKPPTDPLDDETTDLTS